MGWSYRKSLNLGPFRINLSTSRTAEALFRPLTKKATWRPALSTGYVSVMRSTGGGSRPGGLHVTQASSISIDGAPGNNEAVCPSSPSPRRIRSKRGGADAGVLQDLGTGPFFGSKALDVGEIVGRKHGPVPFARDWAGEAKNRARSSAYAPADAAAVSRCVGTGNTCDGGMGAPFSHTLWAMPKLLRGSSGGTNRSSPRKT